MFNNSSSTSVFNSGTLASKLPLLIFKEAEIRFVIDLKNLDENLIAIDIERNKSKVTTTIYIKIKDILIPTLLFSTV